MTPGRGIYEHHRPGELPPEIPWEELLPGDRDFYEDKFAAGLAHTAPTGTATTLTEPKENPVA